MKNEQCVGSSIYTQFVFPLREKKIQEGKGTKDIQWLCIDLSRRKGQEADVQVPPVMDL